MAHILFFLPVLILASSWLYFLTTIAPDISSDFIASVGNKSLHESVKFEPRQVKFSFPSGLEELQQMAQVLKLYYESNWLYVITLFSSSYIYKQAFMIPGSVFLNILAGALFGIWIGFPLCCILTAIGASCCYMISSNFGKDIVLRYFPGKLKYFQKKVEENSNNLTYFLLLLRMFPMSPNWLINLASPIIGIRLSLFVFTAFVGLMPYNLMCVYTGGVLATLTSLESFFKTSTLIQFGIIIIMAVLPNLYFRLKSKPGLSSDLKKDTKSIKVN